jgi:hypothetical protein
MLSARTALDGFHILDLDVIAFSQPLRNLAPQPLLIPRREVLPPHDPHGDFPRHSLIDLCFPNIDQVLEQVVGRPEPAAIPEHEKVRGPPVYAFYDPAWAAARAAIFLS